MISEEYLKKIDPEVTEGYINTHCVCCGKPFKNDEDKNNSDPITQIGCACDGCNTKYIKPVRAKLTGNAVDENNQFTVSQIEEAYMKNVKERDRLVFESRKKVNF